MAITVSGRKMNVTPAIKDYVDEKIGRALEVFDSAAMDAEVVLRTEKNPAISLNAICEVTVNAKGAVIRVAESAEDMYAAIDLASDKVARQLRKYKTKGVDRKLRGSWSFVAVGAAFATCSPTSSISPMSSRPSPRKTTICSCVSRKSRWSR